MEELKEIEDICLNELTEEIAELEWLKDGCKNISKAILKWHEDKVLEARIDELECFTFHKNQRHNIRNLDRRLTILKNKILEVKE